MQAIFRISFIIVSFFAALESHAQNSLLVQVLSKDNGLPMEHVYVNVYQGSPEKRIGTSITNDSGYAAVLVDSFPCVIEAVGLGYEMERITLQSITSKYLQIKLSKTFASLNEVVVTGVLTPVKPMDAFSNYKIITATTMQAMGAVNVQDAIAYQLNAITSTDGILGAQIRMQGMDGNKVKILMDGVPINGREDGNIDLGQLNTYNLERIEIIQGPMTIFYGTDALGGVINLITKNTKKKTGLSAQAYYETIGKYNFNATATHNFDKHHFSLGGGRNYFDGEGNTDTIAPYRRQSFKPKEQYMGNFNYSYTGGEKINLRFASDFIKEKLIVKGSKPNYITPFEGITFDEHYTNTRSINRLTADGKLGKEGHWQLINGYSFYRRSRNEYKRDLVALTNTPTTDSAMSDTTVYHEFSLRGMYDNTVWKKLNYTVGYDVNLQDADSRKIPESASTINDYAVFMQISLPLFNDKIKAQSGLRASYNTAYSSPIIPSFNILYKATPIVSLRASYAKGFRAPALKELYLVFVDFNHRIFGNENLKAEIGDHIQASASWLVFENKTNYAQVLLTGYYNNIYNQIALAARYPGTVNSDSAQFYDYTNILRMRNAIATIEFEGQYSNFHYKLGYSYAHTFAQPDQYDAFTAHELTTTFQYLWKWGKLNFSLFNRTNGARPFLISNIDGTSSYSGRQPLYNMMDVSVSRKFWKQNIQLTAGVKNVFDVVGFSSGNVTTSTHGSSSNISFMPRSLFTSLRFNID